MSIKIISNGYRHEPLPKLQNFKCIFFFQWRVVISPFCTSVCNKMMEKLLLKHKVHDKVSTSYRLYTSDQVEVSNREVKKILQVIVNSRRKDLSDRLDIALGYIIPPIECLSRLLPINYFLANHVFGSRPGIFVF